MHIPASIKSEITAIFLLGLSSIAALSLTGCEEDPTSSQDGGALQSTVDGGNDAIPIDRENADWTEASHSNDVDPNYDEVFPDESVRTLTLTFTPAHWALMQIDLADLQGSGGGPGGGPGALSSETPMWGEATLTTDGVSWHHVGVRYKGNSSLRDAYESNSNKYPFKLDFDQWEDDYLAVDDQRFFGFKQLNLGSNFGDASFMREKVAADLFREFGVPAARTSFVEVFLDVGEGPERLGLYTLVEELDDSMTASQFTNGQSGGNGNLYKPDGDAASFANGSYDTAEYELKTNEDTADYADITALYDALHDESRITDSAAYQAGLEAVFDVAQYLRYLAVNQAIQNWDTYGHSTHNYFLYNTGERLTWIPWDNNEAFQQGKRGGALDLDLQSVTAAWPMLRYIMDIPEYEAAYKDNLDEFVADVFLPSRMATYYDDTALVLDDALDDSERALFPASVAELKAHATSRANAVDAYTAP